MFLDLTVFMVFSAVVVFTVYGFNAVYISVHLSFSLLFFVSAFLQINVFINSKNNVACL